MLYQDRKTIYDYLKNEQIPNGYHSLKLKNGEIIDIEMIEKEGNFVVSSETLVGDNTPDTNMLVLKIKGKLQIEESGVLTPRTRKKGFVIYTENGIINNGVISMTARGAIAEGQEVLLYENRQGTFEKIPAVGAAGGAGLIGPVEQSGNDGKNGINRGLGGGGGGALYSNLASSSGSGGAATSYSGGAGGGGCASYDDTRAAGDGSSTGGAGGDAACRRTTSNGYNASGGAGNPPGLNCYKMSSSGVGSLFPSTSEEGTGGLLIIYCRSFVNNGLIESKGSNSGPASQKNDTHGFTGGGSGGGSVNIFANTCVLGEVCVEGGIGANGKDTGLLNESGKSIFYHGGKGGSGSVTFTSLVENREGLVNKEYLRSIMDDIAYAVASKLSEKVDKSELQESAAYTEVLITELKLLGWTVPKDYVVKNDIQGNIFLQKVGRVNISQLILLENEDTPYNGIFNFNSPLDKNAVSNDIYVRGYRNVDSLDALTDKTIYYKKEDNTITICNQEVETNLVSEILESFKDLYLYYELSETISRCVDVEELTIG